jgi:hypothetical protein
MRFITKDAVCDNLCITGAADNRLMTGGPTRVRRAAGNQRLGAACCGGAAFGSGNADSAGAGAAAAFGALGFLGRIGLCAFGGGPID